MSNVNMLARTMREDPSREMRGGSDPTVLDHFDRVKMQVKDVRLPFLAAKIYGKNPMNAFTPPPLNANETGNTKVQDIQGTHRAPFRGVAKNTLLVQYGGTGGALDSVMTQYKGALDVAGAHRLPTLGAEIYNAPPVKNPRAGNTPYDVAALVNNRSGMVGRIYSNVNTPAQATSSVPEAQHVAAPAGTQATGAAFADKLANWFKTGNFA